jgi:signal transduction histidine kinase
MKTNKHYDKVIVFIFCAVTYLQFNLNQYFIVPIICAVIVSAFMSYKNSSVLNTAIYIVFCAAAVLYPALLFFLPLLCYDIFLTDRKYWILCGCIPLILGFSGLEILTFVFIILIIALSYLIKLSRISYETAKKEFIDMRDTTKEITMQLESKNKELLEKQDYEINNATLNERNRIARDIHDSIGHLLSNAILQTGALMAVNKDDNMQGMLFTLKETLTDGMNSVRNSIHGLYDDSVDLFTDVKIITASFDFCEIVLDYDIDENPDRNIKNAMLYIIKEALSNVMKHSDATSVKLTLKEHPALYQLVIRDNGTVNKMSGDGIGLKNIETRAENLGGHANFKFDKGFVVFASIPKERTI